MGGWLGEWVQVGRVCVLCVVPSRGSFATSYPLVSRQRQLVGFESCRAWVVDTELRCERQARWAAGGNLIGC